MSLGLLDDINQSAFTNAIPQSCFCVHACVKTLVEAGAGHNIWTF